MLPISEARRDCGELAANGRAESTAMKSPRDLADKMKIREADGFFYETFRLPRSEARRRTKQLFDEFPSTSYMTEIETWYESGGMVEFRLKYLNDPIDGSDEP
jgi:hypothetical protein